MRISCVHCGRSIVITKAQLGTKGNCPHCHGPIVLPRAADQLEDDEPKESLSMRAIFDQSISFLSSMVIHIAALLIFAFLQGDSKPGDGPSEEVAIGVLDSEDLEQSPMTELTPAEAVSSSSASALKAELELDSAPPTDYSETSAESIEVALAAPSTGAGDPNGVDFGSGAGSSGGGGGGGSWDSMITQLRQNGLDIVIVFDSTGSMSGEIDQVKRQIERIGNALVKLVPKTRIGLVTYRDEGDDYVVRGIPMTRDIGQVQKFLYGVDADAGGDLPEAVDAGLEWAISHNSFNQRGRKVILIFGDAPPHREKQRFCETLASDFKKSQQGVVSTVTCRQATPLPEFYSISGAGGGEAFISTDTRQIMTQLMVLVFGSRHREKVVEALKLTER